MQILNILSYPRVRMLIAGVLSLALAYGSFLLMLSLGVHYQLASLTNFSVYVVVNFLLNKHWSFKSDGSAGTQALQHFALHAGNQILIMLGLFVLVELARAHPALAQVVMQVLVFLLTFTLTPVIFKSNKIK